MHQVFEILSEQPVLFLFILIGIGMAFGHVKIKGISLGAAAVLFFAIALAAWAQSYDIAAATSPPSWHSRPDALHVRDRHQFGRVILPQLEDRRRPDSVDGCPLRHHRHRWPLPR